jgi:hypothetical protein
MTLNISDNFIAQSAHVGWGYIFVTAPAMLFHVRWWWIALAVVALTGAKEYLDAHGLEDKATAGNSYEDWFFWIIGTLLGVVVLTVSGQVKL